MTRRRVVSLVSAGLILIASMFATAVPAAGKGHLDVLLDGLSSPKGLAAGPKSVAVSQGAFGPPAGPVLEYLLTGKARGTARAISPALNLVDIAATPDGAGWGIGGDGVIYRQATNGTISPVRNMHEYQAGDPDPNNAPPVNDPPLPFEDPAESNPYGLTALSSNDVLVADAAGNDIIRVSPNGTARTVARFPRRVVSGTLAEAVPTSIAIGRDGWAYVGQLVGVPGTPGSANIWRLNPNAVGAVCSAAAANANCRVWKTGFTSIVDLAFNPNNGTLYVYEIAEAGWLAFEEGCFGPSGCPPAVLLEVKGGKTRELVRGQLSQPGGVAVSKNGTVFVTDGMFFGGGRLLRVRN